MYYFIMVISEGDNDEEKDKLSQNTSLQETPSPDSGEKQEEGNQTETELAADSQLQSTEKATSEKVEPESENKTDQQQAAKWTYKAIKKQWRKFNLDLAPKVCTVFSILSASGGTAISKMVATNN